MTNYKLQLERLKRHYEDSVKHYDIISFLDLAHTLRVWTEIKQGIDNSYPTLLISKAVVTKSLKRILKGSEYVYTFLPDGITTYAIATGESNSRNIFYGPYIDKFSAGGMVRINQDGSMSVSQYSLINRVLSGEEIKNLDFESKNVPIEKISYSKYMESPAIYFQFKNWAPNYISNKELIKRVANEYDASHANAEDTNFEINNAFSEPVKKLMEHGCMKLPLPYFVLLHIAKTVIDTYDSKI